MSTKTTVALLLLLLLPLQGCYTQTATQYRIRPNELEKVSGSYSTASQSTSSQDIELEDGEEVTVNTSVTTVDQSIRHFVTPSGRAIEVTGRLNVVVGAQGRRRTFKHPVIVEVTGARVHIHGRDMSASYEMQQIDYAAVEKTGRELSTKGLIVASSVIFLALVMGG